MPSIEQAIYYKNYITQTVASDDMNRLGSSLFTAKISLKPHQIHAAMSFFKNPLSPGIFLADEVGLGKTIEAGLIISQYWHERRRKILIISPASLMKQWNEELFDKFHLESYILDSKSLRRPGFSWQDGIYIVSMHAIYSNVGAFTNRFDLVVIDEVHKLRNVYKTKGVIAQSIKDTFSDQKKLLLTATPFQNDLLELFGLMSILDDRIFADVNVFKDRYIKNYHSNKNELFGILLNYFVRTLRKDVTKYINYTKRNVLVSDYETTVEEQQLYDSVTRLLYSDNFSETYTSGQNHLIIILLQKLLSSSVYAVRSTLQNMIDNIVAGSDTLDIEDEDEEGEAIELTVKADDNYKLALLENLKRCVELADNLNVDSKFDRLLLSINELYENFERDQNRNKKILIFTESKRTQSYLYKRLVESGYKKTIVFNGDNSGETNAEIYKAWLEKQVNTSLTGNKSINMRRAIIDAFENDYEILVATDAAAEGLNMQFCSVLINYDLPWNPQKIEQRIGRCHRFGQKNDVIVINMLNTNSSIDRRIYELLSNKIGIFEDTFGASDAVLGATTISEDIERSIKNVYKTCRSPEEIEKAFIVLQEQFKEEIENALKKSEYDLETYFDEEVQKTFDLQYIEAKAIVNEMSDIFYRILKFAFPNAVYNDANYSFLHEGKRYSLLNDDDNQFYFCSIDSNLGQKALSLIPDSKEQFDNAITLMYSNSGTKIGFVDNNHCSSGTIIGSRIVYDSFEKNEKVVLTGIFDNGIIIPNEICHKILKLKCDSNMKKEIALSQNLKSNHNEEVTKTINDFEQHNSEVFSDEAKFIERWADTMIERVQLSIKEMRKERKQLQLDYDSSTSISEKTAIQEKIHLLSKKISKGWAQLAEVEDEIELRRMALINNLDAERKKSVSVETIFAVDFRMI